MPIMALAAILWSHVSFTIDVDHLETSILGMAEGVETASLVFLDPLHSCLGQKPSQRPFPGYREDRTW